MSLRRQLETIRRRRLVGRSAGASGPVPASLVMNGTNWFQAATAYSTTPGANLTYTIWFKPMPAGTPPSDYDGGLRIGSAAPAYSVFRSQLYTAASVVQWITSLTDNTPAVINNFNLNQSPGAFGRWTFVAFRVNGLAVTQRTDNNAFGTCAGSPLTNPLQTSMTIPQKLEIGIGILPMRNGAKLGPCTLTWGALSDANVQAIKDGDYSSAELYWVPDSSFDGTTWKCNDPTYDMIATGAGITADTGDVQS